jgi:hypothetical protein
MHIENPVIDVAAGFIPAKIINNKGLQAGINPAATKKQNSRPDNRAVYFRSCFREPTLA